MSEMNTKTGLGYYRDQQGHIIAKADLPPGRHVLQDGLLFVEVNNRDELELVEIYTDPADILKQSQATMVSVKTRQIAIDELKREGKLPPDYEE